MSNDISGKADRILEELCNDPSKSKYIDTRYTISKAYIGKRQIRLIILGQDPTVKNETSRKLITTVLNLNKRGSVLVYLSGVCHKLGIVLNQNVYATNLFKNFFYQPPTQIKEIDIFHLFLKAWLPLLQDEIAQFPNIPIITLGQPVMRSLVKPGVQKLMRDYWGYTPEWKKGNLKPFKFINPEDNILNRIIFPFPHIRTNRKEFYKQRLDEYISFMKSVCFI